MRLETLFVVPFLLRLRIIANFEHNLPRLYFVHLHSSLPSFLVFFIFLIFLSYLFLMLSFVSIISARCSVG